jgi:hypothetical protein
MRSIATAVIFCNLFLNIGFVQIKSASSLEPTELEGFAAQPDSYVRWSKKIGDIEGTEARVVITALAVENAKRVPSRMKGVRIDLVNHNASDQVYIEESRLEPIKKALDQIDSEIAEFEKESNEGTKCRYLGAAEFWHPDRRIHTLNAAYYIVPDSSGLSLSAYRAQEFRFPGHRPSELAAVIGRVMDELERH